MPPRCKVEEVMFSKNVQYRAWWFVERMLPFLPFCGVVVKVSCTTLLLRREEGALGALHRISVAQGWRNCSFLFARRILTVTSLPGRSKDAVSLWSTTSAPPPGQKQVSLELRL